MAIHNTSRLQNRVDPFGNLITTKARGDWMGNRGILHNEHQQILRPFKLQAWIICKLEFKNRKRQVMTPNNYTELFFLDEATAFAAGHRPCFECRRPEADRFKTCWIAGNPTYGFNTKTPIKEIDQILHQERIDRQRAKVTFEANSDDLPDGTFVSLHGNAFLVWGQQLYQWSPSGYEKAIPMPGGEAFTVLTPLSVVNAFQAGYVPQITAL